MNKIIKYLTLTFILVFISAKSTFAQGIEMADNFRGEGKIYVVVMVMLTLLVGIFVYLFRLENKIKKLEDDNREETEK